MSSREKQPNLYSAKSINTTSCRVKHSFLETFKDRQLRIQNMIIVRFFVLLSVFLIPSVIMTDNCSPDINWTYCPRFFRFCDTCFSVKLNNPENDTDFMCLRKKDNCIYVGNMIKDGSFAVVTGKPDRCTPFSTDVLEVRISNSVINSIKKLSGV